MKQRRHDDEYEYRYEYRWKHGHGHGHGGPPWGTPGHRCSRRKMGLRKLLFIWFLVAILSTLATMGGVFHLLNRETYRDDADRIGRFASSRFALVWGDAAAREELAAAIERDLRVGVRLQDADGRRVRDWSWPCEGHEHHLCVEDLGTADVCIPMKPFGEPARVVPALLAALFVLMLLSGALARRLSRPLRRVAAVARRLGEGDLEARVEGVHGSEAAILGHTINTMAERISRQLGEQKELLAAVSHEMRTPLGHVRILLELARDELLDEHAIDELEREVDEMDRLVGELLARSRLDFEQVQTRPLDAADLARRALERQGLDLDLLDAPGRYAFEGDPTLLQRALANLLDNARRHAGGVTALRVRRAGDALRFEVEDGGDGFDASAFEPFVGNGSKGRHPSLGLGLALARRIAEAHGGTLDVDTFEGGCRVVLEVAVAPIPD